MEKLWLKANDIPTLTAFNGNIDADSLAPHIYTAQKTEIKRILGLDLYTYIDAAIQAGTPLTGEYETLFNGFVIDMLVYYSCANYMVFGGYKTSNAGIFKQTMENTVSVDSKEIQRLIAEYRALAIAVENSFYEHMKDVEITEYKRDDSRESGRALGWY
jgi:hypothetical protein